MSSNDTMSARKMKPSLKLRMCQEGTFDIRISWWMTNGMSSSEAVRARKMAPSLGRSEKELGMGSEIDLVHFSR